MSNGNNFENLEGIARIVKRANITKNFALVFAVCNDLEEQEDYVEKLRQRCNEDGIILTEVKLLEKPPLKKLLPVIQEHLVKEFPDGIPEKLGVQVTGLELSILLDTNEQSPAVLQIINLNRESYYKDLPFPIIFWLPEYACIKLANVAPDFWSFRLSTPTFCSGETSQIRLPERIEDVKNITTWQDKVGQIPVLERLLNTRQSPDIMADLLIKSGDAYYYTGKTDKARQQYEHAIKVNEDAKVDPQRVAEAYNKLGLIYSDMGEDRESLEKAEQTLHKYLEIIEPLNRTDWVTLAYNHLGLVHDKHRKYSQALKDYEHALDISRTFGHRKAEGDVLGNMGLLYRKQKKYDEALEMHTQALNISRELEDINAMVLDLSNIGLVFFERTEYRKAIDYYNQSRLHNAKIGNKWEEMNQLIHLGDAWKALGDYHQAQENFQSAKEIAEEININIFTVLDCLIELYGLGSLGDADRQILLIKEVLERSSRSGQTTRELQYWEKLCAIYRDRNEVTERNNCLMRMEALIRKQSDSERDKIEFYEKLSKIYAELDKKVELAACKQKLEELNYRQIVAWFDLDQDDSEMEEEQTVLEVGKNYRLNFKVVHESPKYALIYQAKIPLFKETQGQSNYMDALFIEGRRISLEKPGSREPKIKEKEVTQKRDEIFQDNIEIKSEPTSIQSTIYQGSQEAKILYRKQGEKVDKIQSPTPPPFIATQFSPSVSFHVESPEIIFDPSKIDVFLAKNNISDVGTFTVTPKSSGNHRIAVKFHADMFGYQNEFYIPLRVSQQPPSEKYSGNKKSILPFRKSHAFIIGINDYLHLPKLRTAINDAKKLAEILAEEQGFNVYPPLLNARREDIWKLLEKTMPEMVEEKDRCFLYFAGNGIAMESEEVPEGYLIPADADRDKISSFYSMKDLYAAIRKLPCKHFLLILDCSFSGAFKWSSVFEHMSGQSGYKSEHGHIGSIIPKRIFKERFDRFVKDPAWQVITSSSYDQNAIDNIVLNKHDIMHSPFADALIKGLQGAADIFPVDRGDGIITATELYFYIREQVEPQIIEKVGGKIRQTPLLFPMEKHDKGEFIFLNPRHRLNLPPIPARNPYKGMQSFKEADMDLFYGRERIIMDLMRKVYESNLIVVTGAVGTGKSSVVKAGLIPELRRQGYHILPVIRPGKTSVTALEKIVQEANQPGDEVSFTGNIENRDAGSKDTPQHKKILVIDQLEELITQCHGEEDRKRFMEILKQFLDTDKRNLFKIILTVRADFEPQFKSTELEPHWSNARYKVPPLTVGDLREIIIKPAVQMVLEFEPPGLVDRLIEEVIQAPGALSLLSFTLSELYRLYIESGRTNRVLDEEDYKKLGGVIGTLSTRADYLYKKFDRAHQETLRKIMLRMVSIEGSELTGKKVMMEDLEFSQEEEPRIINVVDQLLEARLLVKDKDDNEKVYVEPAHNALIIAWPRLWDWIATHGKEKILLLNRLSEAVKDYEALNDINLLWHNDPRLELLKEELQSPASCLNRHEVDFVKESVKQNKSLFGRLGFRLGGRKKTPSSKLPIDKTPPLEELKGILPEQEREKGKNIFNYLTNYWSRRGKNGIIKKIKPMAKEINITIENKLVSGKQDMNVYHHSTRSAHLISYNSSIKVPLRSVIEDDYLYISIVNSQGRLENKNVVNLPSWTNFEIDNSAAATHENDRIILSIPPGTFTWQLKITWPASSQITHKSDRIIIRDY